MSRSEERVENNFFLNLDLYFNGNEYLFLLNYLGPFRLERIRILLSLKNSLKFRCDPKGMNVGYRKIEIFAMRFE